MPSSSGYKMEAGNIFLLHYTNLLGKQPHRNSKQIRIQKKYVFENWNVTLCSLKEAYRSTRKSYYFSEEQDNRVD